MPTPPPLSVLVRFTDASGAPTTSAYVYSYDDAGIYRPHTAGDGTQFVTFPRAGLYCISITVDSELVGGRGFGGPTFTLDSSGDLIADSENTTDLNPECTFSVTEAVREIDVQLPALTLLKGVALTAGGQPCLGILVQADSGKLHAADATADFDGAFAIYLTPARWSLYAGDAVDLAQTITIGTQEVGGFTLQC